MLERNFSTRLLLKIEQDFIRVKASFDSMISKFDHDSRRFESAINLRNKLSLCQWLADCFLLCRWHSDNLHERKHESNAILEKSLMKRFEIRVLNELKWFLEIRITRNRENRKIWLCQNSYISKIMTKFHLKEMKCSKTSLAEISRFNEITNRFELNSQRIYVFQQRMRFLNFAAIISRSDIAFATIKLIQFLKNSNSNHQMIADRVIAYLNDTKNVIIEYSEDVSEIFLCASDAAFADEELIRKSSDDYFFKLYDDFIDWRAIKQVTMITSSIEVKLLILSQIAKEAIWWRRFFQSIQYDSMKKLHIRCDNRQIIRVLKKEMLKLNTKLKHVDIHWHWLRQKIQTSRISVSWISTAEMSADEFIKVLSRQKHEKFLKQLHLINITHLLINEKRSVWASKS